MRSRLENYFRLRIPPDELANGDPRRRDDVHHDGLHPLRQPLHPLQDRHARSQRVTTATLPVRGAFGSILMGALANYPLAGARAGHGPQRLLHLHRRPRHGSSVAGPPLGASSSSPASSSCCSPSRHPPEASRRGPSPAPRRGRRHGIGLFIAFIGLRNANIIVSQSRDHRHARQPARALHAILRHLRHQRPDRGVTGLPRQSVDADRRARLRWPRASSSTRSSTLPRPLIRWPSARPHSTSTSAVP